MKTIQTILKELEDEGISPDEIQQRSTEIMRQSIETKLKLQGAPPPKVIAGVNTDHMLALFKWIIDVMMADATQDERDEAWHAFELYRNWDITARHYDAYVQTTKEE